MPGLGIENAVSLIERKPEVMGVRGVIQREVCEWISDEYGRGMAYRLNKEVNRDKVTKEDLLMKIMHEHALTRLMIAAPSSMDDGLVGSFKVALERAYEKTRDKNMSQVEMLGWMGQVAAVRLLRAAFEKVEGMKVEEILATAREDIYGMTDIRVGDARVTVKAINGLREVVFGKFGPQHSDLDLNLGLQVDLENGAKREVVSVNDVRRMQGMIEGDSGDPAVCAYYLIVPAVDDKRYVDGGCWFRGIMNKAATDKAVDIILNSPDCDTFMTVAGID